VVAIKMRLQGSTSMRSDGAFCNPRKSANRSGRGCLPIRLPFGGRGAPRAVLTHSCTRRKGCRRKAGGRWLIHVRKLAEQLERGG
jgi:hypothetical protein